MKRLLCLLGIHSYGDWYPVDYYDGKNIYTYEHNCCINCGNIKKR